MEAYVGAKIGICAPTEEMYRWCRDNLVVSNPDYEKKKRMGLWTGNVPMQFYLYEEVDQYLMIPFGCASRIHAAFPDMPMRSLIKTPLGSVSYDSHIELYGYQYDAVLAMLNAKNGVLVMPCGSGKTNCGLEIVARLGVKTLWLTHTQDLLTQSMNRAKSVLGIDSSTYGTITDGKVKIGSGITFATVQTASRIDLAPYKDEWGCVIVDECHRAVGSPTKAMQFYRVLSKLSCRYKIGLTATPKRGDGMSSTMFALLGDVVHEVSREEVADTTCPVEVVQVETGYMPDLDVVLCGDGTISYANLVRDLTENQERFEVVRDTVEDCAKKGSVLVLANRVNYLQRLNDAFSGKSRCLSGAGNSKAAKDERKSALKALNDGEIDCLFASYQLAAEGLDCPNLKYVIFATPEKDVRIIEQSSGRVARKSDGKDVGVVIDFIDSFGLYKGWSKKRNSLYKKLEYVIM